jgi:hypothetical protein
MPTEKQQYVAELNAISDRYGSLEDTTIKRMLAMVKELRSQIAAEIVVVTDWDQFRIAQLRENLGALIRRLEGQLLAEVQGAVNLAYQYGGESVAEPFQALGIADVFFKPNPAQLNVLLDFSARLIQNIGDDMRTAIDKQVRLAALGQKSIVNTMKDITTALGVEAKAGIWKKRHDPVHGVAARAETDLRTELQRVFNLSTFSQQQASAERIPGLTKSWVATGDVRTRPSHLRAHVQYKDNPIPINQPFIVGPKKARLMYPGDPNGPPEETIQCRCRSVTHHPAVGRVGSSLDGRIAAELKRRQA